MSCQKVIQSGPRKGMVCGKPCGSKDNCKYHQKQKEEAAYKKEKIQQKNERERKIKDAPDANPDAYHAEMGMFVHEIVTELIKLREEFEELEDKYFDDRCECYNGVW